MRRVAAVVVLTLSAWLGLAVRADAQCLITPVGPTAFRLPASLDAGPAFPAPGPDVSSDPLLTTPVARGGGPARALLPRDYKRGVRRAE